MRNAAMQTSIVNPRRRTKRKSSNLTTEEVSNVVSLLKNLVAVLDEEDEEGQIVIENVQNVICKLSRLLLPRHCMSLFFSIVVLPIDNSFQNIFSEDKLSSMLK
jgi:hypothetical protein